MDFSTLKDRFQQSQGTQQPFQTQQQDPIFVLREQYKYNKKLYKKILTFCQFANLQTEFQKLETLNQIRDILLESYVMYRKKNKIKIPDDDEDEDEEQENGNGKNGKRKK